MNKNEIAKTEKMLRKMGFNGKQIKAFLDALKGKIGKAKEGRLKCQ